MKVGVWISLLVALALLSGCASTSVDDVKSVTDAGVTSVNVGPEVADADSVNMGTRYRAVFGKEYGNFTLTAEFDEHGRPKNLQVTAGDVGAFVGQQAAANAIVAVQQELSAMGVEMTSDITSAVVESVLKAFAPQN